MSEIRLLEMFSLHGLVKTLTNIIDKETRIPKGYAFVTMLDDAGAVRAIAALNGVMINGRTISVRFADGQKTSELGGEDTNSEPITIKKTSSAQTPLSDYQRIKRLRRRF